MGRSTYTETLQYWWTPTVSTQSAPTTTEMGDAKNITCLLNAFPDLAVDVSTIDDQSLCSAFVPKLPDTLSVDNTEIEVKYDDSPSSDAEWVRTNLTRNATGFLVRIDSVSGTIPPVTTQGTVVDVWPVQVTKNAKNTPAFGEQKTFTIGFAITGEPSEGVAVV